MELEQELSLLRALLWWNCSPRPFLPGVLAPTRSVEKQNLGMWQFASLICWGGRAPLCVPVPRTGPGPTLLTCVPSEAVKPCPRAAGFFCPCGPGGAGQVGAPRRRHQAGAKATGVTVGHKQPLKVTVRCRPGTCRGRRRRQSDGEEGARRPGENLSKPQKKEGRRGRPLRGLWPGSPQSCEDTESSLDTTHFKTQLTHGEEKPQQE